MDKNHVQSQLKQILIDDLFIEVPEEMIKDDDSIGTDLGLDSIGFVELATIIRERFGIRVEEADITSGVFATIGSLTEWITSMVEAKCAS